MTPASGAIVCRSTATILVLASPLHDMLPVRNKRIFGTMIIGNGSRIAEKQRASRTFSGTPELAT